MHFQNKSSTTDLLPCQATTRFHYSDRLSTLGDEDEDEDGDDLAMTQEQRRALQLYLQPQQRQRPMNDHETFSSPRPPTLLQSPSSLIPSRVTTTPTSAASAAVTPTQMEPVGQSSTTMHVSKPKSKSRQSRKLQLPTNRHRRKNNNDIQTERNEKAKSPRAKKIKSSSKHLSPTQASSSPSLLDRIGPIVFNRPPRTRTEGPIEVPHTHDVLSGRGVTIYRHSGNMKFQQIVSKWKEEYIMKTSLKDKPKIVQRVVDELEALDPPGRFLELMEPQNSKSAWIEMDRKKALAKVSQALREGATSIRRAEQSKGLLQRDGVTEGSKLMSSSGSSSSDSEEDSVLSEASYSSKSSLSRQRRLSSESESDSDDDEGSNDVARSYSDSVSYTKSKKSPVKKSLASKRSTAATPTEKRTSVSPSTRIFKKVISPTGASKSMGVEEYCPKLKRQIIFEPRSTDVISGRGAAIYQHSGNILLRNIVKERKETYILKAVRREKVEMVQEVMDVIKGLDPPGRFLELRDPPKDEKGNNVWVEMDETKALSKISQSLREGATEVRRTTGNSGKGTVDVNDNGKVYEEALLPTKKQAIMRLAVEKLCTRTGKVLEVYQDAEEARRSVTDTTNKQPFIKALRGKGKCGREYHGYFWRVVGSKETPQTSSLNASALPTEGSASSGQKRRTGTESSGSPGFNQVSKRSRTMHVSENTPAESGDDSSSESESEDGTDGDSGSSDAVNEHHIADRMDTDEEEDAVDLDQMEDSGVLELPVEKLCMETGQVLNTFETARDAIRSVTTKPNREKKFIDVLRGEREDGRYFKGFFWRVAGSSITPDKATS